MVTNATIEALLGRRSIRKFKDEAIDDDTRATLETVAQHAASSQFLNDWSAIRIIDPAIKAKLAEFGHQPYIATAPLLYVFVIGEHRNARIAERKGESYEWGWLQNIRQGSATNFCDVDACGDAYSWDASDSVGVRPAFLIKLS